MDGDRRRGEHAVTAARRRHVLQVALRCFAENGLDTTSLRQIAAEAGMTHAGLLHHFGSKDQLVIAALIERDRQDSEASSSAPREPIGDGASRAPDLMAMLAEHQRDPQIMRLQIELMAAAGRAEHPAHEHYVRRYELVRATMSDLLTRRAAAGALRPHVDPELAAILMAAVLDGVQAQYVLDADVPLLAAVEHFLELILRPGAKLPDHGPPRSRESVDRSVGDPDVPGQADVSVAERILAAARWRFAIQGLAGTSIQDVAAAAGCSKATVLYHFGSKTGLFAQAAAPLAEDLGSLAAALPAQPTPVSQPDALSALISVAVSNRDLAGLVSQVSRGQDPAAGAPRLATAIEALTDAWDPGGGPEARDLVRFALLGMFAFCHSSPDLDDAALTHALDRTLGALLLTAPGDGSVEQIAPAQVVQND